MTIGGIERAVLVPFGGRNVRQPAAARSTNRQVAKPREQGTSATRGHVQFRDATHSTFAETPLLTGGLLVRVQPEEPLFSMGYGVLRNRTIRPF